MNPFKQLWGWFLSAQVPRCGTCGTAMEAVSFSDPQGTEFRCPHKERADHKVQDDMYGQWLVRAKTLEAEFEAEDAALPDNYDRRRHGRPSVQIRRKQP